MWMQSSCPRTPDRGRRRPGRGGRTGPPVLWLVAAFLLAVRPSSAQDPSFPLQDLFTGASTPSSFPAEFQSAGGLVFLRAASSGEGVELRAGDPGGLQLVRDIAPGVLGAGVTDLTSLNDLVFFRAAEADHGAEVWRSDGTAGGTVLLKDIVPGPGGSSPGDLVAAGGKLFFRADDGVVGEELWVSDGTTAGTTLVADLRPGMQGSFPRDLTPFAGGILFSADDGANGRELWFSDGLTATLVADIAAGPPSSSPGGFVVVGNQVFFAADDGIHGAELWLSDGTSGGTVLAADLSPGTSGSFPGSLVALGSMLLFEATDGMTGFELWGYDLIAGQAALVRDIRPGMAGSFPGELTLSGGLVFFSAADGVTGTELWASDGTAMGTQLVADINPGPSSAAPADLTDLGGLLVFAANDGTLGAELWSSDGTSTGTVQVADIRPGADGSQPRELAVLDGVLWFSADDGVDGREPWVSDGTSGGTHLVQDVFAGASSNPAELTSVGGQLFFRALEDMTGIELWRTDGTPAGTQLVVDIRPGLLGSGPTELRSLGNDLVFSAFADSIGVEPWISDGTAAGTVPLMDLNPGSGGSFPRFFTAFNGGLAFQASDGVTGSELWFTDGTAAGTTLVRDIEPGSAGGTPRGFVAVGSQLFFSAAELLFGEELWVTDGTTAGTVRVADIRPGFSGSSPADGVALNGLFAFTAEDGVAGRELWISDGTAGGTSLVLDIRSGPLGSEPRDLTVSGGLLYFTADDGVSGREPWVSDGTPAGTMPLGDLQPGSAGSEPRDLFPFAGGIVFSAREDASGRELWTSDGTPAGTSLLRDLVPGPGSSAPSDFATVAAGSVLVFAAGDPEHGRELWHSDGTALNTRRLADIAAGPASSSPASFVEVGGTIVFVADDDVTGRELRALAAADAACFPSAPPVPTVDPLPVIMGECPLAVGPAPTATDTCGQQVQGTTSDPLVFSTPGSHTITWTYFDGVQTTQQVQTVQVVDTTAPVPIVDPLPALTVECPFTVPPPEAMDGCIGLVTATTTDPVSFQSTGVFTITWTYFDGINTTQQVQTVQVQDTTPPVPDVSPLPVLTGECPLTVTTIPTATDACAGTVLGTTLSPLSYSQAGTFLVQWQYSDGINVSSQSQIVVVTDTTLPTIVCPPDITVMNDPGLCGAAVTFPAPSATDACGVAPVVTQTDGPASGAVFPVGTTTVGFAATDSEGNTANCTFTVTVLDGENPSLLCPPGVTVPAEPGSCAATVTFASPTASDNCPGVGVNLVAGLPSGSAFPLGTTLQTFTAVDAAGNTATCSFSVTVEDTEAPAILCPQPISVTADAGQCGAVVAYVDPVGSDNCPGVTTQRIGGLGSGVLFPVGVTTEVWEVMDAAGAVATCSFTITVTDGEAPVLSGCPADITVTNEPGVCTASVTWSAPTATDNCPGVAVTADHAPGDPFPVGVTTVTYVATDGAGNATSCSFDVTVQDGEAPLLGGCPSDITVGNDAGACSAVVTWTPPAVSDNCPGVLLSSDHSPGDVFAVAPAASVTYLAVDLSGNIATCTFTVTVQDVEVPILSACPADITVNADPGACGAQVSWTPPSVGDNCPGAVLTSDHVPGETFGVGLPTLVTYTAIDASGGVATCSFNVTVVDGELPQITACPPDLTVVADPGDCAAAVSWAPPAASDNCPGVVLSSNLQPGDVFSVGAPTLVTYQAVDASGNSATCSFTVMVIDGEAPVITGCPADITVSNDPGLCMAAVTWTSPAVIDNCPGPTLTADHAPGEDFPVGTTIVTYTAADGAGNTAVCSFAVTVQDAEGPNLGPCPADVTIRLSPGDCQGPATWTPPPLLGDNCPGAFVNSTHSPGDLFPLGTTVVSYVAVDAQGNTTQCTFNVTMEGDFEAPEALGLFGAGSPAPAGPVDVLTADLGSGAGALLPDGHLDVAVLNATNLELAIFFNDGFGGFQTPPTVVGLASLGAEPRAFVVGDFDGLGGADFAIAFRSSDVVGMLLNDGTAWTPGGQIPLFGAAETGGLGRRPVALAVGDLDGSGVDDLVVAMEGLASGAGQGVAVVTNLTAISPLTVTGGFRGPRGVALLDSGGASQPDLAVIEEATGFSTRNVLLFEADGTGGFTEAASHLNVPANPRSLVTADLEGTGFKDDVAVLSVDQDGGTLDAVVTLFPRSVTSGALSAGSFQPAVSRGILSDGLCLAVGDLRGDTLPFGLHPAQDLITGSGAASGWEWSGGFDPTAQDFQFSGSCASPGPVTRVTLGDLNGDGLDDVVTVDDTGDVLRIWRSVERPLADVFGAGCPGSQGTPQISAPVLPALGASVHVDLGQALGGAVAVLGVSSGLVPSGAPPCLTYLASPVLTFSFATNGAGEVVFPFDIPPAPSFAGTELIFQWAVFDPMGAFLNVIALSPGLRMRIGL